MKEAIGDALRSFAKSTTPEELARKGVRRVRSVSMAQFAAMIDVAIDRALDERGLAVSADERAEIAEGASAQLHRMMDAREELAARHAHVADLRAELKRTSLEAVPERDAGGAPPDTIGGAHDRIAILERRIEKLAHALGETERSLETALTSFDGGLRSGVDRSDGPKDDDPRRDQKLDMMRGVFDANQGLDRG